MNKIEAVVRQVTIGAFAVCSKAAVPYYAIHLPKSSILGINIQLLLDFWSAYVTLRENIIWYQLFFAYTWTLLIILQKPF